LLFAGFQFHFRRQEFALAEQFVRRRLALAERGSALMARILTNLGLIHFFRDELAESESAFRAAIEIDRANGDEVSLARDMGNLALVPEKRDALDEAERLYRDALAIAERVGAKAIIATKLANLGDIALTFAGTATRRGVCGRARRRCLRNWGMRSTGRRWWGNCGGSTPSESGSVSVRARPSAVTCGVCPHSGHGVPAASPVRS
jgi:tetratricopeptide (TPR) repeat protein